MLTHFADLVRTAFAFAVVLGVLVFVHELGHYLAARWRGVHVEVFSIGFGKALIGWKDRLGTRWKVAWLPLGGYVKLHGQERPQDVPPEIRATWIPGRTFQEKSVLSRAIVVAAGPVANFLLAIVLFAALFMAIGQPIVSPVVGDVLTGSAADRAGLRADDRIEAIGGQPIGTFEDIQRIISAHPAEQLSIVVKRGDTVRTLEVTTDERMSGTQRVGILGIKGKEVVYRPATPVTALGQAVRHTWDITYETVAGIAGMIGGKRGTDELGGPLRIAQLSGQVAELGLGSLISFIAILSVNLGLINLLPIPVLDGGHLLFYLAEAIRGRPIPPRAQEYSFRAGLAVLAAVFIFATWNDLSNFGLFRWVAGLIG